MVWSNYKKESDAWQGALEFKETFMRRFLDQAGGTLRERCYDTSKLEEVLKALMTEATILASAAATA